MERIPHRELRNNSSAILRRVEAGESFEITNHGEVVAVLGPPGSRPLRVIEPTRKGGWADLPRHKIDTPTQQILDELRQDVV